MVLEKDFWVCWLLGLLFGSEFAGSLVFKGGTSLSKVFGVIERFSEDIDLSLSPEFLKLPEAGTSRNQANKWMTKAEAACAKAVKTQIAPALEAAAEAVLGKRDGGWFEFLTDANTNSPVLLFHYPSSQPAGFEYLKRAVKLEFGSLTDQQPVGRHPVRPWVADVLPVAFPDWQCEVVVLEVERSFWEKATILHTEYHRPADKPPFVLAGNPSRVFDLQGIVFDDRRDIDPELDPADEPDPHRTLKNLEILPVFLVVNLNQAVARELQQRAEPLLGRPIARIVRAEIHVEPIVLGLA